MGRYAGHRHHWCSSSPLCQDLPRSLHLQPGFRLRPLGPLRAPALGVFVLAETGLVVILQLPFAVRRAHAGPAHSSERPGWPRRCVDIAVRRLAHAERCAVSPRFSDRLHLHVEACLLGTGDVEGCVTVGFVTLDAGAWATLLADVAGELPAGGRDVLDAVDRLQKDRVCKADLENGRKTFDYWDNMRNQSKSLQLICQKSLHLWDPKRTDYMSPAPVIRLFESPALVRTQSTVHRSARRLQAAPTQPLTLWDVGNAVALLVHCQVAHVTEQDHVAVLTLAVIADAADGILVD